MSDLTKAARTEFEKIFRDLKNVAGDSKGFWRDLPYDMCDQPNPSFQVKNIFYYFFHLLIF